MKQITIYDLLPLLKKGWVAMDSDGRWFWHNRKPVLYQGSWYSVCEKVCLCECFDIVFFDGSWKDSLIKVEHKEKAE